MNTLLLGGELPEYSKDSYLIYWLKLSRKVSLSLNIVSTRIGQCVYRPLSITEIQTYLNISESTWYRFMKESIHIHSINIVDNIVYLNPRFNFNVWNINKDTVAIFKDYDALFLKYITDNNLNILDTEPYELLSTSNKKVKSNCISTTLYKLSAKEKHLDRFSYEDTKYVGMKDKIEVFCNVHKHKFEVVAENHLNSNGGCPLCAFEHRAYTYYELPTLFYIIKVGELYKIGITTNTIKQRYKGEGVLYDIIFVKEYPSGKEAYKLEQWCLVTFKKYKYNGEGVFKNTGNTEIFTEDISRHTKFIDRITKS